MSLPAIDFDAIAATAKEALVAYGTDAEFFEKNSTTGRLIKVVVYRNTESVVLQADIDTMPATAILNPDDFAPPNRMPAKFDKIRVAVGGFVRTYTIESSAPIMAKNTLPLILVQLEAN
jgi:hypothetical protein